MYKTINFSTKTFDKSGREYFKPPTYSIAERLQGMEFEDYRIHVKGDFTTISVFSIPIYQKSSLFQAEKTGPKILIGKFYFDDNTGKITLHIPNILNYKPTHSEAPIPELLFSCIRPEDFIEVICPTKYRAKKTKLTELGKIKNVKHLGDLRMIEKIKFVKLAWGVKL